MFCLFLGSKLRNSLESETARTRRNFIHEIRRENLSQNNCVPLPGSMYGTLFVIG